MFPWVIVLWWEFVFSFLSSFLVSAWLGPPSLSFRFKFPGGDEMSFPSSSDVELVSDLGQAYAKRALLALERLRE
jgi:hypothetical protein